MAELDDDMCTEWLKQCLPKVVQPEIDIDNGNRLVCAFADFVTEKNDNELNCVINLVFESKSRYFPNNMYNFFATLFERSFMFVYSKHTTDIKELTFQNINLSDQKWESITTAHGSEKQTWAKGNARNCCKCSYPFEPILITKDFKTWKRDHNTTGDVGEPMLQRRISNALDDTPIVGGCGECIYGGDNSKKCVKNTISGTIIKRQSLLHKKKSNNEVSESDSSTKKRPIIYVNTMSHLMDSKPQNPKLPLTIWESFPVFKGSKDDAVSFSKGFIPYKNNLCCCCAEACCFCFFGKDGATKPNSWDKKNWKWKGKKKAIGKYWKSIALTVILLIVTIVAGRSIYSHLGSWLEHLNHWIRKHKIKGCWIYFSIITFNSLAFLPVSFLEVFASFVLGPALSIPLSLSGKQIGSSFAFLFGRLFLRKRIKNIVMDSQSLCMTGHIIVDNQWKMVLLLRFMFIPMSITSYSLGPLNITFMCFFICSLLASLPYSILFGMVGYFSKTVVEILKGQSRKRAGYVAMSLGGFTVLVFIVLLYILTKRAKEEQKKIT